MIDLIIKLNLPILFIVNIFLLLVGIYFLSFLRSYEVSTPQRIHDDCTPRLGGAIIFLGLFIFCSYFSNIEYYSMFLYFFLIPAIPIFITTLIEDIYQNINPKIRLLAMLMSTMIFFCNYPNLILPELEFLFYLKDNPFVVYPIMVISILAITNGFNIIDGANGLSSITLITCSLCILFLAIKFNDQLFVALSFILIFTNLPFIFLNYPLGKIFLGDTGAYLNGWMISLLVILFFGRHNEIHTWNAVLILFYPGIEIIFSFIRKNYFENISPFKADINHLHSRIFYRLKYTNLFSSRVANSLILPILSFFWLFPLIILVFFYEDLFLVISALCILTVLYCCFFFSIPKVIKIDKI